MDDDGGGGLYICDEVLQCAFGIWMMGCREVADGCRGCRGGEMDRAYCHLEIREWSGLDACRQKWVVGSTMVIG